ncbi:MAG: YfhO family protein, partial [Clostridia bacterium]|nr:YfhO family protein [Clostridia bacterium]
YAPSFYRALALSVFSPWDGPGNFLALNLAPLAAPGLIALLFMRGGKARQARVALVLCFAAACVPAAGLVINAGAYVTNRWSYALNMFSALGCALGLPVAFEKRGTHSKIIAGLAMGVSLLLAAGILKWGDKKQLVAPGLLFAFAALLLAYQLDLTRQLNQHRLCACASILLAISCALYAAIGYLPRGYGYILQQEPVGLYDAIASRSGAQLIDDDGVYRVSQGKFDDANAPVLDYMGTSFHWSLVNARISAYYQKLNLPTLSTTYHVYGLGANAWMNTAASVKYFMKHDGDDHVVPYGFQEEQQLTMPDGSAAAVYENSHALPLGYAFDATLSEHDYDALPVEARFQALLERAIVDEPGAMAAVPERSIESAAVTVPYEIVGMENVEMDGKSIRAEENGRIRLSFHPEADSEVYVLFKGLKTNSDAKVHDGLITLQTGEGIAEANVLHPRNNFYYAKEDYAFCIGSLAPQGCDIVFECAMDYTYDELRVVALPMAAYRAAAEARRSEAMTDVELGRDSIKGRISIAGDRILQIAVPHSDGWRAWVDGQEQPVLHCGGMYMGIALDAGEHDIEMRYVTPGLIPGAIISAIALLVTLALAIVTRRRRRHGRERA